MKQKKNFWRALLAFAMVFCLVSGEATPIINAAGSSKVTQANINKLKNNSSDLSKQKKNLQAKLDALANDKSQAMQRKKLLDEQIAATTGQIENAEEQIRNYELLIAEAEEDLADAEEREEAQYDLFCRRVRAMEEQGTVSFWAVLFRATSFSDLLGRLDIINEIMESDQRVIDDLKSLQEEIKEKEAVLETEKAETEEVRAELAAHKAELDSKRAEATRVIQEIAASEDATEAEIDGLEDEQNRIQAEIKALNKKLEEQKAAEAAAAAAAAAAAGQSKPANNNRTNPGGYIWPVDSRYVTSTVGGRASPGGIGSTNHKGTDIGRVGYSSSIYAAKAGTVIISTYGGGYGNYVVISHGNGNTTLYGHMSSRKVSVGQTVKQGQVIGITGSTGNSTGPHLHFEVMENNQIVNPLSHGASPRKGYLSGYTLSGSA